MTSEERRQEWMIYRFVGGVVLYIATLLAGVINSYNSGEYTAMNLVVPVLLLVIAVSIAAASYARLEKE